MLSSQFRVRSSPEPRKIKSQPKRSHSHQHRRRTRASHQHQKLIDQKRNQHDVQTDMTEMCGQASDAVTLSLTLST